MIQRQSTRFQPLSAVTAASAARCRALGLALAVAVALVALPLAAAAVPATLLFEGVLRSAGGSPAADGDYAVEFALYLDAQAATPLWKETLAAVPVKGGALQAILGANTPISDAALASATLIGVKVGSDPELPRLPLHAVAFARLAGTAADLACSGCVSVSELAFDGDLDLGGNSIKAKNAAFSGDLIAKTVTAQSFAGDGSKLTGIVTPAGSCKSGEAVVGIASDGSLQCKAVSAGSGKLATLTGGLLTNEFSSAASPTNLPITIPDNTGSEAAAQATIDEAGSIETITVSIALANSDLSKVRVVLLPPDDKVNGITLCDPCGGSNEKQLIATYPAPQTPSKGDLSAYIGKSGKGLWTLKVLDSGFCVPQLPGNNVLCDVAKATDGTIAAFTVTVKVLSSSNVAVPGTLVPGWFQLPTDPSVLPTCEAKVKGLSFMDTKTGLLMACDGADWRTINFNVACGNGIVSGSEECDDKNSVDTDACTNGCKKAICGDKIVQAGVEECDDGNKDSNDGCSATCKSEQAAVGCSDGSAEETWSVDMVGCDGSFLKSNFTSACSTGWHPANANEYATYGGKTKAPSKIYWVDTAWDAAGKDTSLANWDGHYDSSNGAGWNGLSQNSDCTWIASPSEACYLSFANHDYGQLKGCHCRGGNPNSTGHGVVCVRNTKALPRL